MYDVLLVSKWFINKLKEDNKPYNIISLMNLIYLAHGWNLEILGYPLINNRIEAWKTSIVIPDLYNKYKEGLTNLDNISFSKNEEHILNEVIKIYSNKSYEELLVINKSIGSPYYITSALFGYFAPIDNNLIKIYFRKIRSNKGKVLNK